MVANRQKSDNVKCKIRREASWLCNGFLHPLSRYHTKQLRFLFSHSALYPRALREREEASMRKLSTTLRAIVAALLFVFGRLKQRLLTTWNWFYARDVYLILPSPNVIWWELVIARQYVIDFNREGGTSCFKLVASESLVVINNFCPGWRVGNCTFRCLRGFYATVCVDWLKEDWIVLIYTVTYSDSGISSRSVLFICSNSEGIFGFITEIEESRW